VQLAQAVDEDGTRQGVLREVLFVAICSYNLYQYVVTFTTNPTFKA
jgi:hypothetical protein